MRKRFMLSFVLIEKVKVYLKVKTEKIMVLEEQNERKEEIILFHYNSFGIS